MPFCSGTFYIFSSPEPESLADFYLSHHYDPEDPKFKTTMRKKAKEVLSKYYKKYGERLKDIGDPRDIKKKLNGHRAQRAGENNDALSSQG